MTPPIGVVALPLGLIFNAILVVQGCADPLLDSGSA